MIISTDQFAEHVRPISGLPISHVWRGYGSAIFIEFGDLTECTVQYRGGRQSIFHDGQFGVMIQWSWRVERPRSIYFGSWSTNKVIDNRLPKLLHKTVKSIEVEGRLPELVIELSEGLWVHSFSTNEGQPYWCLYLDRKQIPNLWLKSEGGRVVLESDPKHESNVVS